MDRNALTFLLKYSTPFSVLVVSEEDKLVEIHCPFRVKAIKVVKNIMVGEFRMVTQVKLATNNKLVFIINDTPFYYYYFDIIIH